MLLLRRLPQAAKLFVRKKTGATSPEHAACQSAGLATLPAEIMDLIFDEVYYNYSNDIENTTLITFDSSTMI